MSESRTLDDISADLKRKAATARAAYEAAWETRMAEWQQGLHRVDIGQDGEYYCGDPV